MPNPMKEIPSRTIPPPTKPVFPSPHEVIEIADETVRGPTSVHQEHLPVRHDGPDKDSAPPPTTESTATSQHPHSSVEPASQKCSAEHTDVPHTNTPILPESSSQGSVTLGQQQPGGIENPPSETHPETDLQSDGETVPTMSPPVDLETKITSFHRYCPAERRKTTQL